jgi:hypothetical protein
MDIMLYKQMKGWLMDSTCQYSAALTREQFLFYEMRTTAKLMSAGQSDDKIIKRIMDENLFQYPTEKSVKKVAAACIRRLKALHDNDLINSIATEPSAVAKQICLFAMMKQSRLIWEFMLTVIAEKYRTKDSTFGKVDLIIFFLRLQEQDDKVASWSDTTITKLKQVIAKVLVETEFLDSVKAEKLNPVWLNPVLENAIRSNNDQVVLPAFNCFS